MEKPVSQSRETESEARIVIPRIGGADVLTVERFTPSSPAAGEVAIQVEAIGINFADVFCRLGLYEAAPPRPFAPGFEVAGRVAETGAGVTAFNEGDRVLATTFFGGYTTRLHVDAAWARPLPEAWSFEEGAAFPVAYLTAYHGLVNLGRLAAGETVVVQAAAGGVGTAACQIAGALGARVIGTVGSDAKREVAKAAGASEVIVSPDYRVWDEIGHLTQDGGVDLVFESVGGREMQRGFDALRAGGRLIVCGFSQMMPRGGKRNWPVMAWRYLRTPRFNPFRMTESNRTVAGFNLVHLWGRVDLFAESIDALLAMAERGDVRSWVGRTFPFDQAREAHEFLQSRRSTGKVILVR